MLRKTFYISLISTIFVVSAVLLSLPTPTKKTSNAIHLNTSLLITNVTVFDGTKFDGPRDIEVQDGIIQNVANNIQVNGQLIINGNGRVVIPGLIDTHTHTFGDALASALNFGVTTQIDMFSPPPLLPAAIEQRNDIEQNSKADLFSAGVLATAEGGHGTQFGVEIETIDSSTNIDQWLDSRIQEGSDFIKLVYMPYSNYFKSLDRSTAANIVKRAHKKNLKVVAHISSLKAANELLEEGIDGFVHIFADEIADSNFIQQAKAKGIFIIPTLSVIASATGKSYGSDLALNPAIAPFLMPGQKQHLNNDFGEHVIPGFDFKIALENTRLLYQAGVPILAGSDAPNPGTSYGASLHQEMELLELAGLSTIDSLRAATIEAANLFDLKDRGAIQKGAKADFLILNSNELKNIVSSREIDAIYKNGKLVNRTAATLASSSATILNPSLSQFSQGLNTDIGITWSKTDDAMANGTSQANIYLEDKILNVDTVIGTGFMFPWAGASGFSDQASNISKFRQVRFKIRGSEGQYRAMMFDTSTAGAPPSQTFSVSDQWREVRLDLDKFIGLDINNFIGIAIVSGPSIGEFKYQLDDVKLIP